MVFDLNVLCCIAYFLTEVVDIGNFALCSKQFHKAARLATTRVLRWRLLNASVINAILFDPQVQFFAHLITKVRIISCLTLSCLALSKAKVTDVIVNVRKSTKFSVRDIVGFDNLTGFGIEYQRSCTVELERFPKQMEICYLEKVVDESVAFNWDRNLPVHATEIIWKIGLPKTIALPVAIRTLELYQSDSFSFAELLTFALSLRTLVLTGEERLKVLPGLVGKFPKLRKLVLHRKSNNDVVLSRLTPICIQSSNFPSLKHLSVTRLKFINDLGLKNVSTETEDLETEMKFE